jgi:carboxy-cis,cis-muconate cyclase
MKKWSSFSVRSPTEIVHEASHEMGGDRKNLSGEIEYL